MSAETIVAISTPVGQSALGVIRLSGDLSIPLVDRLMKFVSSKSLRNQNSHTLHWGFIQDGEIVLDEVVVGLMKGPRSYTGEDMVEISAHGNPLILNRIVELCVCVKELDWQNQENSLSALFLMEKRISRKLKP